MIAQRLVTGAAFSSFEDSHRFFLIARARRSPYDSFLLSCAEGQDVVAPREPVLAGTPPEDVAATRSFCVGPTKLIVMTLATFAFYPLYWFYKNWKVEQAVSGEAISPVLRTFFILIFFYSFASRVKDHAMIAEVPARYSPLLLSIAIVAIWLASYLPDPAFLVVFLLPLPVLPIQRTLERLNAAKGFGNGPEWQFTAVNIIGIVLSALFWLLVIVSLMLPDPGEI